MPEAGAGTQSVPGMLRITSTRGVVLEYVNTRSSVTSPSGSTTGVLTDDGRAPLVAEEIGELVQGVVEVVDDNADVEVVGCLHDGSITTRTAPPALSDATRNASAASSMGKRCVIRVRTISGSSASMAAASSISRPPSCAQ